MELSGLLLQLAIDYLIPLAFGLLTWLIVRATKWVNTKIEHERTTLVSEAAYSAINLASGAVTTAVDAIQQTVVKEMRLAAADGKITADEARAVRDSAIEAAKVQLGTNGLKALEQALGGPANDWLKTQVEAVVHRSKSSW